MIYSSLFLILSALLSLHAQSVATPANIVCYQEVVASQGSYAQISASLTAWSQRMYQTLGLTGPIELVAGFARVPDRTGFENGCNGPYPNIADLFVHIQTTSSQYDSVSSQLESFIAANRLTSQPNIACSARSVVTFLPGCGKVGAAPNPPNNATQAPSVNATTAPPSNATEAPTGGPNPTNAPSNQTTTAPTEAPTNATTAPTEAPTNATTSPPTNSTAPTEAPSNSTSAPTEAPSTGLESNTSSNGNSTSSSTSEGAQVAGAASDQSATGSITINGASSTTITTSWIAVPCIMALVPMFQH